MELERASLLERLRETSDIGLVCLIAPSGYGKTTLLAQHARRCDRPVVWLSLSEDDAEPESLAASLERALQKALPELTLEHAERLGTDRLAGHLARGLDQATQNLEIIVDESDHLSQESGRWLERFLRELGEGHRVLLAGRTEAPIGLARLVARGQAIIVGAEALVFSRAETETYLMRAGFAGNVQGVFETLEGWSAGIALAASGATPHLTPADLILEVIESLEPALFENVSDAAVLEVWTERAAQVLGCDLPEGWLESLRRSGLPMTPLGQEAFRPHRLVTDTLEAELQRRPARHRELHERAATQALEAGDSLRALRHLHQANLEDRALTVAVPLVARFEGRGEYHLVRQVLEPFKRPLPAGLQRSLGHALGQTGEPERAETILQALADGPNPAPEVFHSLSVLASREGQHSEQLRLATLGLEHADSALEQIPLIRSQSNALYALGQYEAALERALEAVHLAELHAQPAQLGLAWFHVADAERGLGHRQESAQAMHLAINTLDANDVPVQTLPLLNDLANDHLLGGRTDEALELLLHAIPIAEREASVMQAILLETLGECRFWRSEIELANTAFETAIELGLSFRLSALVVRCHAKLSECALRLGDTERAHTHLLELRGFRPVASTQAATAFAEALHAIERGEPEWANQQLASITAQTVDQQYEPRARAYQCLIAHRQGQLAETHVRALVDSLERFGTLEVLRVDAATLEPMLAQAVKQGWHTERLASLRSTPIASSSPGKPTLELTTLGTLQARLNGQLVHLPFAKAGELLVWLAQHGPATRERIIDALWDGSNEQRHVEYFKVAVRRLRNALQETLGDAFNPLPFEQGVYRLAVQLEVRLDTAHTLQALRQRTPELEAVLRSPLGEFMPEADSEWVRFARDQFVQDALEAAMQLSDLSASSQPDLAALALEFALRVDPSSEEAYLRLIELHLAQQDPTAAQRAYRELSRMLKDTFDAEPPAELAARFEAPRGKVNQR